MSASKSNKNRKSTNDNSAPSKPDTLSGIMDPQTQLREIQQL